jgi:hypothetical protein
MDCGNLMPEESRGKSVHPVFSKKVKEGKDIFRMSFLFCLQKGRRHSRIGGKR